MNKTIILSTADNDPNGAKAILTLTDQGNPAGKLRLYNSPALTSDTFAGLYYKNQVFQAKLTKNQGFYHFDLPQTLDLTQDIYCALLTPSKDIVMSGGSYGDMFFNEQSVFWGDTDPETEKYIDECVTAEPEPVPAEPDPVAPQCEHCVYKDDFYHDHTEDAYSSDTNLQSADTNTQPTDTNTQGDFFAQFENAQTADTHIENITRQPESPSAQPDTADIIEPAEPNNEVSDFLSLISDQIDEMLSKYPLDPDLNRIIAHSKFIKILDEYDDTTYSIGIIYDGDDIKYLAYAVPARYNATAPAELGANYQWLPLDPDDPMSDGYFIVYQDALDGSVVRFTYG